MGMQMVKHPCPPPETDAQLARKRHRELVDAIKVLTSVVAAVGGMGLGCLAVIAWLVAR
jgi:hypothetical protein